ncbi:ABC transporter permease [Devosia sp. SD17-2]|uniref:ABC transporter permease n=1 Tax=Devosia sp. SD17-2 TaxID=2976459 RepID=UPI0023D88028|nr:ABC transporter permease [Devosia sp. SD17-2]WEJ31498.1 ABC transporter permease [Devosia sp. SD17-2]
MNQTPDISPTTTALLVAPAAVLMFGVFVLPFLFLVVLSFWSQVPGSLSLDTSFTLANYVRIFTDSYYLGGLWTTLWLSGFVTLVCLLLALPLARWIVLHAGRAKGLLIGISILPLICGALLPTLGLVNLLSPLGFINGALKSMGLIQSSLPLLGNITGVTIGLVQAFLPLMVLPLINTIERIPHDYEMAAMSLGASPLVVWRRVLLPLMLPGIVAGSLLVFCAALTAFVTPQILGQGKVITFASLAYQQAAMVLDWPFASALGIVMLMFLALAGVLGALISRRLARAS